MPPGNFQYSIAADIKSISYRGIQYFDSVTAFLQWQYVSVREDATEEETVADKADRIAADKAAKKAAKAKKTEEPVLETADSELPF